MRKSVSDGGANVHAMHELPLREALPDKWRWEVIDDIAEVNPRIDKSKIPDNLMVSFVPMPAVGAGNGSIDVNQKKSFSEVKKGFTPFKEGDVLFAKITPCMENGKMAVVPKVSNGYGFGSTEFHVLRPKEGINAIYIYYYVSSKTFRGEAERYMTGAVGQRRVPTPYLRESKIPVAPLNEQTLIVSEIEKQFSRLDEAVAALKRIKANLKRYKASVLKAAVEGKLTEEWRKDHPDVEPASELLKRILVERRRKWEEAELEKMRAKGKEPKDEKWKKKFKEPSVPEADKYPQLPIEWTFTGIEQLLLIDKDAMKTGPFGSLLKKHEHKSEGVPVLGIESIQSMRFVKGSKIHISKEKAKQLTGYCALPGDILISRSGTVGEVCVVPNDIGEARISTNLMKISLVKEGMLPEFFTFLFNGSPFVLRQVDELCKGSTRNFLNQEILKRLVFILPPIDEQQMIIQEVDRQYTLLSEIEAEVDRNTKRAERLRQSILKKAFSGHLIKHDLEK